MGRAELAARVDLRLGSESRRLPTRGSRTGGHYRPAGVVDRALGTSRFAATNSPCWHRRRRRGFGLLVAPAAALRPGLYGVARHHRGEAAKPLVALAARVVLGPEP